MPNTVLHKYPPVKHYLYYGFILLALGSMYEVKTIPAYQDAPKAEGAGENHATPSVEAPRSRAVTPIATPNQAPADGTIKRSEWVQIFISGLVALLVLWQAWIYNELRKMANRQNWETYLAERAYIGLRALEVSDLHPNKKPFMRLKLVNGGKTPAWNVTLQIKWNIGPEPVFRPWNPDFGTSHMFLAAGETNTSKARLEPRLTEGSVRGLEDDSMKFFATIQCRFVDFRGERREATFSGAYYRDKNTFVWHREKDQSPNSN